MRFASRFAVRRHRLVLATLMTLLVLGVGCAATLAGASFDRAVAAFDAGDYRGAIAQIEQNLRTGRETARDRILLGWSYLKLGDFERARVELERGLKLGPRDANAYYAHEGLGWIAYRTGYQNRALASFNEALRLTPGYHNAHDGLGWVYLSRGDIVRAEANFMAAQKRAPDDRDARRGLGLSPGRLDGRDRPLPVGAPGGGRRQRHPLGAGLGPLLPGRHRGGPADLPGRGQA